MGRLLSPPLFLVCNLNPSNRYWTKVLVESDVAYVVIMALMSTSNGYLTSISIMFSTKQVKEPKEQELVGNFMTLLCSLGPVTGALLSSALVKLL